MKKLIFLLLLLAGCSNNDDSSFRKEPIIDGNNVRSLYDACEELGQCMKASKYEIVHIQGQSSNPYVCSVWIGDRNAFFYPDLDTSWQKPSFGHLKHAIQTCQLMTKTGEFSDEYREKVRKTFEAMDRDKKERAAQAAKDNERRTRKIPIKEFQ